MLRKLKVDFPQKYTLLKDALAARLPLPSTGMSHTTPAARARARVQASPSSVKTSSSPLVPPTPSTPHTPRILKNFARTTQSSLRCTQGPASAASTWCTRDNSVRITQSLLCRALPHKRLAHALLSVQPLCRQNITATASLVGDISTEPPSFAQRATAVQTQRANFERYVKILESRFRDSGENDPDRERFPALGECFCRRKGGS